MESLEAQQTINLRPADFKSLLQEELVKRLRKNPSYSLRSFSKSLGISHSALAEMLNGKRAITKKSIERLGLILGLSLSSIQDYQRELKQERTDKFVDYQQLTIDQFAFISDWYHYAIYEGQKFSIRWDGEYLDYIQGLNSSEYSPLKFYKTLRMRFQDSWKELPLVMAYTQKKLGRIIKLGDFFDAVPENTQFYDMKNDKDYIRFIHWGIDALTLNQGVFPEFADIFGEAKFDTTDLLPSYGNYYNGFHFGWYLDIDAKKIKELCRGIQGEKNYPLIDVYKQSLIFADCGSLNVPSDMLIYTFRLYDFN